MSLVRRAKPAAAPMHVALLGTGLLGGAIGRRLLERGHRLTAWNRHPERLAPLLTPGPDGARASAAGSAAEAVAAAGAEGWVVTVLADGAATATVLLDQAGARLGRRRVLQMGTIGPEESRRLAQAVGERGGRWLEAPVLGSRPEALAGRLQIMAGGPADLFDQALPLLRDLGPCPRRLGPVGCGLEAKLALNQLIASLTHAFSLSLHLATAAGIDPEAFMELLRGSALHAPTFDKKLGRMLTDDYGDPNFPTAHLRKDLLLFLDSARRHGLTVAGLECLGALLERAAGSPLDDLDYSALHRLTGPAGRARPPAPPRGNGSPPESSSPPPPGIPGPG
ncbi:MAG: NAD(P)-dependent oxidoreductase [Synechococcaceae cyanobacterium]|nr:NAD(P)-dependent oxidoreductase [Synechococcaceae cyanobacterium]